MSFSQSCARATLLVGRHASRSIHEGRRAATERRHDCTILFGPQSVVGVKLLDIQTELTTLLLLQYLFLVLNEVWTWAERLRLPIVLHVLPIEGPVEHQCRRIVRVGASAQARETARILLSVERFLVDIDLVLLRELQVFLDMHEVALPLRVE